MHPVAFAFQIIQPGAVQPPQAALHRDHEIVAGAAGQIFLGLFQLLGKCKIRHRLQHIVQRPHRVAPDGILRHIGDEDQDDVCIHLPDALCRGHAVQMLHLHIQKNNVVDGAVIVQNVHPVRKDRYLKFCPVLPGIPPDVLLQYPLHLRVILYDCHPDHDRTSLTTPLWNCYGSIIAQSRRVCQVPAPTSFHLQILRYRGVLSLAGVVYSI